MRQRTHKRTVGGVGSALKKAANKSARVRVLSIHPLCDGRFEIRDGLEVLGSSQNEMMAVWTAVSLAEEVTMSGLHARVVRRVLGEEIEEWPNPELIEHGTCSESVEYRSSPSSGETFLSEQPGLPSISEVCAPISSSTFVPSSASGDSARKTHHLLKRVMMEVPWAALIRAGTFLSRVLYTRAEWIAKWGRLGIIGITHWGLLTAAAYRAVLKDDGLRAALSFTTIAIVRKYLAERIPALGGFMLGLSRRHQRQGHDGPVY